MHLVRTGLFSVDKQRLKPQTELALFHLHMIKNDMVVRVEHQMLLFRYVNKEETFSFRPHLAALKFNALSQLT